MKDLALLSQRLESKLDNWNSLILWSEETCSLQGQELLVSLLLELHPELVDNLEHYHSSDEFLDLDPVMPVQTLKQVIENRYAWALKVDFSESGSRDIFGIGRRIMALSIFCAAVILLKSLSMIT